MAQCQAFALALLLLLDSSSARFSFPSSSSRSMPKEEDPYQVLGVRSRRATVDAIKKAYRKKAKESHPDKNPDMDPDEAADKFRRVVDAFEILSDPVKRKQYDHQYKRRFSQRQEQGQRQQQNNVHKEQRKRRQQKQQQEQQQQSRKDQLLQEAKLAQSRVLRLSSVEQFRSVLLDQQGNYERHFLCVFVVTKKIETLVDDEWMFPFPFAGLGSNGIWWEDVIQTAKVRYNTHTPLTVMFDAPWVKEAKKSGKPYIVFGRKGDPIGKFSVFRPPKSSSSWGDKNSKQSQLEAWVHDLLTMRVTVVNYHHSEVKLFLKDGKTNTIQPLQKVPSGYQTTLGLHTADKILAMDARVDSFPGGTWSADLMQEATDYVLLGQYIVKTEPTIEIFERTCVDLSLRCKVWASHPPPRHPTTQSASASSCDNNPEFMHHICAATCGVCSEHNPASFFTLIYFAMFRYPVVQIRPKILRPVARFLRVLTEDLLRVVSLRKNVALLFFAAGATLGMNLVFLQNFYFWAFGTRTTRRRSASSKPNSGITCSSWADVEWVLQLLAVSLVATWCWIAIAPRVPSWLGSFQRDLHHVLKWQVDAMVGLLFLGYGFFLLSRRIIHWVRAAASAKRGGDGTETTMQRRIILSAVTLACFAAGAVATLFLLMTKIGHHEQRSKRWKHMWFIRKNAAVAFLVSGMILGAGVRPLLQTLWKLKGLILKLVLNALVLGAFDYVIVSQDRHFWNDLDHVVKMRMSVAIPFWVVGVLVVLWSSHSLKRLKLHLRSKYYGDKVQKSKAD
jgi:hypothetical protein